MGTKVIQDKGRTQVGEEDKPDIRSPGKLSVNKEDKS